jgi:hypothetical protein
MKLLKLIPTATIALTVLLPFEVKATDVPSGWTQVGQSCSSDWLFGDEYRKAKKDSDHSKYGVRGKNGWVVKNVEQCEANEKMNDNCGNKYSPTCS